MDWKPFCSDLMSNVFSSGPVWFLALPGFMPILSAALTYFQMASMNTTTGGSDAVNSQMKIMQIIFQ